MPHQPNHLKMIYSTVAQPAGDILWRPAADVYRLKSGWLLKFELAGVTVDDIHVSARGSAITVRGVRRDTMIEENCCQYSMEISYSRFERTIHLPCQIEDASLDIQYKQGILLVRVAAG